MATRKKPAERVDELLDTAQELFHVHGYEQIRVDDILDAVGISKGGFYHHFRSKDDLLKRLIRREIQDLVELVERITAQNEPLPALIETIKVGSSYLDGEAGILTSLSTFAARALYIEVVEQELSRHLGPTVVAILEKGIESGVFNPVPPEATAQIFLAINNHGNRQSILGKWSAAEESAYNRASVALLGQYLGVSGSLAEVENQLARNIHEY